jgi:hypothetical protein
MTENKIASYVESLASDDMVHVITDMAKTSMYINKLHMYIDELEDKKIILSDKLSNGSTMNTHDSIKLKNDIADCNRTIRRIQNDISYVKTSSIAFAFYAESKQCMDKDTFKSIEKKINGRMLINVVSVGDMLQCIISDGNTQAGISYVCENIDKFNALVSMEGCKGYYDINNFRPLKNKK